MSQQENREDSINTEPLAELELTTEQAEQTKAGGQFHSFGSFTGGTSVAGARF
jgi:hypothetical protein